MKVFHREVLSLFIEDAGPVRGTQDGQAYNLQRTVSYYQLRTGFHWSDEAGNRVKNLRGPFATLALARAAALAFYLGV